MFSHFIVDKNISENQFMKNVTNVHSLILLDLFLKLFLLPAFCIIGKPVDPACESEMREFSIMIFEDYELSPVIVGSCDREIDHYCKHLIGRKQDGAMMGCLMDVATNNSVSDKCYEAVSVFGFGVE